MDNIHKVLVVDDEPRNQRIIMEALEDIADLVVASTGEEALQILETFTPDLILLDIMMPGIDGYEVCQRLRAKPEHLLTKIILISGKAMVEERLQGYACGADDYMTKPFVPEELLAKSKVYLRLSQAEKEIAKLNVALENKVHQKTIQLMSTEEKLFSVGTAIDVTTPLNNISVLARHIETLISTPVIERSLIFEKLKMIHKTIERIHFILDPESADHQKKTGA